MTFSKAWLEKKIMCGLCNFGCCNHPSFHVEITEEEQEFYQKEYGLDLELEWNQDGCCKVLKDDNTGCSLGDDRPLFCKLYPLVENKSNRLVMNNWGYLHCPKPDNYELDKVVDGKYHYKLKKKHKNKRDKLILDDKSYVTAERNKSSIKIANEELLSLLNQFIKYSVMWML